jgi:hypothetical protein
MHNQSQQGDEMNEKQFEKNKTWINQQLGKAYPGVRVFWKGLDPTIEIADGCEYFVPEVIEFVKDLYRQCGGECMFNLDKMKATK